MNEKPEKNVEDWVSVALPIPSHWSYVDFGSAFDVLSTNGIKIPEGQYAASGRFPIIDQGKSFVGGYTDAESHVINQDGTVIVFGDHTRCFKLVNFPFAPGADGTKVLCPAPYLLPKFAYYGCLSLKLPDRGYSRHYSFLKRSRFPIAPIDEQRRIVAKIEELFSELDKGIENLTIARKQLKTYRQAILKAAFEGKLCNASIAQGNSWIARPLGGLIEFLTSGSRGWADYYSKHGDIFIRAQNLKHDRLDLTDIAYVRLPQGNTEGVRTRVRQGDVLITITGANVTKAGLVDTELGPAYVSQHVALCRLTDDLQPEFLYWYLLSEAGGRGQLNEAAYGAGKPGLSLENIRNVVVPVPSVCDQKLVVSEIKRLIEGQQQTDAEIEVELARAEALRQSILKRAFSGLLVAQDSEDEPASVLLERIRAEHDEGRTTKRRNNKNGKKEAA